MNLKSVLTSVFIVGIILVATLAYIDGLKAGYSKTYDSGDFNATIDRYRSIENNTKVIYNETQNILYPYILRRDCSGCNVDKRIQDVAF